MHPIRILRTIPPPPPPPPMSIACSCRCRQSHQLAAGGIDQASRAAASIAFYAQAAPLLSPPSCAAFFGHKHGGQLDDEGARAIVLCGGRGPCGFGRRTIPLVPAPRYRRRLQSRTPGVHDVLWRQPPTPPHAFCSAFNRSLFPHPSAFPSEEMELNIGALSIADDLDADDLNSDHREREVRRPRPAARPLPPRMRSCPLRVSWRPSTRSCR